MDWSTLRTAYGTAEYIPEMIAQLRAASDEEAVQVLSDIRNHIFHQHTLYPVTPYVIDLLIDVIQGDNLACLVGMLGDIARTCKQNTILLADQTLRQISKHLPDYVNWLNHESTVVRVYMPYLLAAFPSANELRHALAAETDRYVQSSLLFALGEQDTDAEVMRMLRSFQRSDDRLIAYAATIALNQFEPVPDQASLEILKSTALDIGTIEKTKRAVAFGFPWMEYCNRFEVIRHLLHVNDVEALADVWVHLIRQDTANTIYHVTYPIMKSLWKHDALRQTLLREIYSNPLLWVNFNTSVKQVFMDLGLPTQRREWKALLSIDDAYPMSEEQAEAVIQRIGGTDAYVQLKTLSLRYIGNNRFLPILAQCSNLVELNLSDCEIDADQLAGLPVFVNLRELQLVNVPCTEKAAIFLSQHSQLEILSLGHTGFRDEWLQHLQHLQKLRLLILIGNDISVTAIQQLKQHLADGCVVKK